MISSRIFLFLRLLMVTLNLYVIIILFFLIVDVTKFYILNLDVILYCMVVCICSFTNQFGNSISIYGDGRSVVIILLFHLIIIIIILFTHTHVALVIKHRPHTKCSQCQSYKNVSPHSPYNILQHPHSLDCFRQTSQSTSLSRCSTGLHRKPTIQDSFLRDVPNISCSLQ